MISTALAPATVDRTGWYADSLQQIEQVLYPQPVQFAVQVELGGRQYPFRTWAGEQLPDRLLAYDCETAVIQAGEIPPLALATVYGDQGSGYFVHPDDLAQFVQQHAGAYWCCHNATFDFWVTARQLQADPAGLACWWEIAGSSRLLCTLLLDELIRLAQSDAEPVHRDLGTVAAEHAGLQLDKSDPYRLRYGELIGLPATAWASTEPGFWQYAGRDPIATLRVAQEQFKIASQLIKPYRAQLLPDALRRFGPLTVCLQVQGAIALDYISRSGVEIDLEKAQALQQTIAELVEQHRLELEQLLPGAFKRYGPRSKHAGGLKRTDSGVPRRDAKLIKQHLEQIVKAADEPIRLPRLQDGSCTDAVAFWAQHRDLHPFIAAYISYGEQAKLAQFLQGLKQPTAYPQYRPLVRTGRTSCTDPNLQQLPRDSRFREMIVPPFGYWLLQIDFSVLELRTLAQICLRRFGKSVLADLFRQGIDPHKYTAALLLGKTLDQFGQLPPAEQKQYRQRAKAINFGVPGGLGAASLVSYAKQSYGVQLTIQQAREFRQRLLTQIYPELSAYLQDDPQPAIAINLHRTQQAVRQALPRVEQIETASQIISGCTAAPGGDAYQPELIRHVWQLMRQLNRDPELQAALQAEQPSPELMRRCLYGAAVTISGRLRGHVNFTQRANSPFQGIAADGNKLALFRLLRAGYRLCGFVHDEVLLLIPDGTDYTAAVQHVQQVLHTAMQELTPDVPIRTEYLLADRWYKSAGEQPTDAAGRIVPYDGYAVAERSAIVWAETAPAADVQRALEQALAELDSITQPERLAGQLLLPLQSSQPADQSETVVLESERSMRTKRSAKRNRHPETIHSFVPPSAAEFLPERLPLQPEQPPAVPASIQPDQQPQQRRYDPDLIWGDTKP